MNFKSPMVSALLALLERDPDAGLLPYLKLAARMGVAKRRLEYAIERLRSKQIISRNQHGRLVVGIAPSTPISQEATRPRQVLTVGAVQQNLGGRKRKDRKLQPRTDGKVAQHDPTPATLTAETQRELQRRLHDEQKRADAEVADRVRRRELNAAASAVTPRKRICFDCGNLAHRRPRFRRCSCGERYEPELIEVVTFGQSSIARCGD